MTEGQVILTGWKDICNACGIKSIKTMKKKATRHKIPIRMVDGKPMIAVVDLLKWMRQVQ